MAILVCETDWSQTESTAKKDYIMKDSKLKCTDFQWWAISTLVESTNFHLDLIKPYKSLNSNKASTVQNGPEIDAIQTKKELPTVAENDERFVKDWLRLFETGTRSDMIIYGRDEEAVSAHSLVIYTRCKRLLDNVIVENGNSQFISMPEVSKNVITAFLKYL